MLHGSINIMQAIRVQTVHDGHHRRCDDARFFPQANKMYLLAVFHI
jgi:hypothetical protein